MVSKFSPIDKEEILNLRDELLNIQNIFYEKFEVDDIISNSKIYEILIANTLGHDLIKGHSGSRDATDSSGNQYEYKHFKETSSNKSWTFNDYTDNTIEKLKQTKSVIFAHINDLVDPPIFDWYYEVDGKIVSKYLTDHTSSIQNTRKMINVSPNQIETRLGIEKIFNKQNMSGIYSKELSKLNNCVKNLENTSNIKNLMTSNKIWELLTAIELNHNVNSEQGGRAGAHDAYDENYNQFEYKISKSTSWNFQDISDNVLNKYREIRNFILVRKDPFNIKIQIIYFVKVEPAITRLIEKLEEKKARAGGNLRRLQVSLTMRDIREIIEKEIVVE